VKLYHGTTEKVARRALEVGLQPREEQEGNWKHTVEGGADRVYLTNSYAGYFAGCAAQEGERWGIVEVDVEALDELWLVPDEDFLEQASRGDVNGPPGSMIERTVWFRDHIKVFQGHWKLSLELLGNCAYMDEIPPEAISKVAIYNPSGDNPMGWMAMDPVICLMNYKICGEKYRALTRWFVGELVEPEVLFGYSWLAMNEKQRAEAAKICSDRSQLEVLVNK